MKKGRRLCGLLVLLCVFLTACSAAAETEPVSISFMHGWGGSGADHVGMRELFAAFKAENPDIHIVYDTSPDLGIVMEKAADMLAVDKTPNIISTNGTARMVSAVATPVSSVCASEVVAAEPSVDGCTVCVGCTVVGSETVGCSGSDGVVGCSFTV